MLIIIIITIHSTRSSCNSTIVVSAAPALVVVPCSSCCFCCCCCSCSCDCCCCCCCFYSVSNGYSLFTIETLPAITHLPNNERLGEVSRRWKKLSEDKKEAYNLKAEEVHNDDTVAVIKFQKKLIYININK